MEYNVEKSKDDVIEQREQLKVTNQLFEIVDTKKQREARLWLDEKVNT